MAALNVAMVAAMLLTAAILGAAVPVAFVSAQSPIVQNPIQASSGDSGEISGAIWLDENRDGFRGAAEYGVPNGLVKLIDQEHNEVLAITLTDILGEYHFDGISAGSYVIEFVPPLGYGFVDATKVGASTHDNDANPQTGATPVITLLADGVAPNWDAAIYREGSTVSGRVWIDLDQDNRQSGSEFGYVDMQVTLYNAFGRAIQIVRTNQFGEYRFENVLPSEYTIVFDLPNSRNNQSVVASGLRIDGAGRTASFMVNPNESVEQLDLVLLPTPTSLDLMEEPEMDDENAHPSPTQGQLLPRSYMPIVASLR